MSHRFFGFAVIAVLVATSGNAQEDDQRMQQLESEIRQIRDLYERRLQALEDELQRVRSERRAGGIEELRRKAAERAEAAERDRRIDEAAGRLAGPGSIVSSRLNEFNPRITVFGDFLGRSDSTRVPGEDDPTDNAGDRFAVRELEIDFRADIDPYAKGVAILAFEEIFNEFEVAVEEAYIDLHTIPGLEDVRHNLDFKFGRFRTEFGVINRLHTHDLMWPSRPLPYIAFLGEEGDIGQGVGFDYLIHNPWDEALTFTFQAVNGENPEIFAGRRSNDLAYLGRLAWHKQVTNSHEFLLGSSVFHGNAETDERVLDVPVRRSRDEEFRPSTLLGFDAFWRWRPEGEDRYETSFVVQTEWYLHWREDLVERSFLVDVDADGNPLAEPAEVVFESEETRFRWGFFVAPQYQFLKDFYVGARFDYLSGPEHARNEWGWKAGGYFSYYTSEFLRFRVGYEHEDDGTGFRNDTVFLQVTWVFGSHPVEPYWFNK